MGSDDQTKSTRGCDVCTVLVIARPQDCCFGLFIGDLLRDRIHSCLPGKSLTEVDVFMLFW